MRFRYVVGDAVQTLLGPKTKTPQAIRIGLRRLQNNYSSAYGKRLGGFACVRRRSRNPLFLGSAFALYRQLLLFFAGVAVRVAVHSNGFFSLQERLLLLVQIFNCMQACWLWNRVTSHNVTKFLIG